MGEIVVVFDEHAFDGMIGVPEWPAPVFLFDLLPGPQCIAAGIVYAARRRHHHGGAIWRDCLVHLDDELLAFVVARYADDAVDLDVAPVDGMFTTQLQDRIAQQLADHVLLLGRPHGNRWSRGHNGHGAALNPLWSNKESRISKDVGMS